jgi:hypothetical protein
MQWSDVQLKSDAVGAEFLEFTERTTKTRQGATKDARHFAPKMFATGSYS